MTGSFKVRGVANQFVHIPAEVIDNKRSLVSMSAGNYGKAFAFASKKQNLSATLCMPETAPANRVTLIEVGTHFPGVYNKASVSSNNQEPV